MIGLHSFTVLPECNGKNGMKHQESDFIRFHRFFSEVVSKMKSKCTQWIVCSIYVGCTKNIYIYCFIYSQGSFGWDVLYL